MDSCYGLTLTAENSVLDVKGPSEKDWPLSEPQQTGNGLHVDPYGGLWSHDYRMVMLKPPKEGPDDNLAGYSMTAGFDRDDQDNWLSPDMPWNITNPHGGGNLIVHGEVFMQWRIHGTNADVLADGVFWAHPDTAPTTWPQWYRVGRSRTLIGTQDRADYSGTMPFDMVIPPSSTMPLHRHVGLWLGADGEWPRVDANVSVKMVARATGWLAQN